MKVWIVSFVVLFGLAELYQWVKGFSLPLPIYILAGAALAIASNYEKTFGSLMGSQTATYEGELMNDTPPEITAQQEGKSPLPQSSSKSESSISFTINRNEQEQSDWGEHKQESADW